MTDMETRELHDLLFSFMDMFHIKFLYRFKQKNESNSGMKKKNHIKIIIMLYQFKSLTSTEISKMLDIEKGSLTTIIDQLTETGFVVRCDVAKDRRKSLLSLTDLGKTLMENVLDDHVQSIQETFRDVDPDEVDQFVDNLKYVVNIMNRL